jgi:hypothetical protein
MNDLEMRKVLALPGLELRPLGSPARSQSLYRLRYIRFDIIHPYDSTSFNLPLSLKYLPETSDRFQCRNPYVCAVYVVTALASGYFEGALKNLILHIIKLDSINFRTGGPL